MTKNARVIALYLPQYHPTDSNDKWWGKGFTEWTNVAKAKKLFRGHQQPKIPADLGFYDLRLKSVRQQQADLAKDHGVEGFCYYHYWFGNGRMELDLPFKEVLQSKEPDFPFCLCWANESWYSKTWDINGDEVRSPLVEQSYPGEKDMKDHFESLLPAFKDERYIKVNGKPLFMIYKPLDMPEVKTFMAFWQQLARQAGLPGIYFVAHTRHADSEVSENFENGFDAVNVLRLNEAMRFVFKKKGALQRLYRKLRNNPRVTKYQEVYPLLVGKEEEQSNVFPCIVPNWDHTPRSGSGGSVLYQSTPELFKKHVDQVISKISDKDYEEKIIFLKSWNEWGEGNYMEPDRIDGKGFLEALKSALIT